MTTKEYAPQMEVMQMEAVQMEVMQMEATQNNLLLLNNYYK